MEIFLQKKNSINCTTLAVFYTCSITKDDFTFRLYKNYLISEGLLDRESQELQIENTLNFMKKEMTHWLVNSNMFGGKHFYDCSIHLLEMNGSISGYHSIVEFSDHPINIYGFLFDKFDLRNKVYDPMIGFFSTKDYDLNSKNIIRSYEIRRKQ